MPQHLQGDLVRIDQDREITPGLAEGGLRDEVRTVRPSSGLSVRLKDTVACHLFLALLLL